MLTFLALHFPREGKDSRWSADGYFGVTVLPDDRVRLRTREGKVSMRAAVDLYDLAARLERVGTLSELWADLNPELI